MADNQTIVVSVLNCTENSLPQFLSSQGDMLDRVFQKENPDRSSVEETLKTSFAFFAKNCGIPGREIILMLNKADKLIFK